MWSRRLTLHTLWIATALAVLLPSAADPDLWGHLLFGTVLLGGHLPLQNGFAYTTGTYPWVNHELLAEISMASVFHAFGPVGLVGMKVGLGLATLLIVWRTALRRSGDETASALATAVAVSVMAPGLMIRPQLFTLLFLAATLAVLHRHRFQVRGTAWVLPLLVALWVNTHGGVLAGVGLATIGFGTALAARAVRGKAVARDVATTLALAAMLGTALLVNPYGTDLLRFLATDVTPRVPITEWAPVPLGDRSFLLFKVMVVTVTLGIVLGLRASLTGRRTAVSRRRGTTLPEAAIVVTAAAAALLHRRHIPLFAIAAAPLLAGTLVEAWRWLERRLAGRADLGLARHTVTAMAVLQLALTVACGVATQGRIDVDPRYYPIQAMRFLSQNQIVGNVALPFRWGEYALWALAAGTRVAVDGRFTTAYPAGLLEESWRFMTGEPGWDDLLTRYPTDVVIADRRYATARLLRDDPEWQYVYGDPVSVVFLRRVARHAATLERFATDGLRYDASPLDTVFPASTPQPASLALPSEQPFAPVGACRTADAASAERRAWRVGERKRGPSSVDRPQPPRAGLAALLG